MTRARADNGVRRRSLAFLADLASRWAPDPGDGDRFVRAIDFAQRTRAFIDDVQTAMWHVSGLPSRQDIKKLYRRTAELGRRIAEIERAVEELAAIDDER
jgi:hypothetical protein